MRMRMIRMMIVSVLVVVRAAVLVFVLVHMELRRSDTGPEHAVGVHVRVTKRQAAECPLQVGKRQAGVDERAERHVARNAREAVEIEDPAHRFRVSLKL